MDFQVPKRPFYYLPIELNLFYLVSVVPSLFYNFFFFLTY